MARPTLYRHPKFVNLQILLDTIPPHALGYLTMIWETGWESGNPVVGSAAVIERIACWPGEPGKLCASLLNAGGEDGKPGFIVEAEGRPGIYAIHDFWDHAPEYVKDRKRKEDSRKNRGKSSSSGERPKKSDFVPDKTGQAPDKVGQSPEMSGEILDVSGFCLKKSATPTPTPTPTPAPAHKNTNSRACEKESENAIAQKPADFDPLKAQNEAKRLAKLYTERTKCPHSNAGCEGAIYALLNAQVASTSILEAAIAGYAEDPKRKNADSKYTLSGRKFFGEGGWEEYKDGKAPATIDDDPQNLRKATAKILAEKAERRRQIELERPEVERQDAEFLKTYGVPRTFFNRGMAHAGKLKTLAEIAAESEQKAQGGAA